MTNAIKILAFGASNSRNSINQQLAQHAAEVLRDSFRPGSEIEGLDLNAYEMPIYSAEREAAGIPQEAHDFLARFDTVDAIILSLAEYNGSYTPAFKNTFDWASRLAMKVFHDKPMLLMSAAPGGRGGANVHKTAVASFPFFGTEIASTFSLGLFAENFGDGALTDPDRIAELHAAVAALNAAIPES